MGTGMAEHVSSISRPSAATAHPSTIYTAMGLRGDPFPADPLAGSWVSIPVRTSALDEITTWLDAEPGTASGIGLVSGAHGSGKTRLFAELVAHLARSEDRLIGVIPDSGERRSDAQVLRSAITAFGGTPRGRTGLELTNELRTLLADHAADTREPVLMIDNAAFGGSQLEILRNVLSPGPRGDQPRVQVMLFGSPELGDRIARRRSLAGYLQMAVNLAPLDRGGIAQLVEARVAAMRLPGQRPDPLFSPDAITALWQVSGGTIGIVTTVAGLALLDAIALQGRVIEESTVRAIAARLGERMDDPEWARTATDDTVLQTRLSLPGIEDADAATPRRRGRQQ
jgi:type II secretory pathway predicted ATPase ExeA